MVKYFHSTEVALHNSADDCWVSIHGSVLDLSEFLGANRGPLARPIIEAAGGDISFWFDKATGDVKTYMDPDRLLTLPYTPMGRFLHVPPPEPTSEWNTDFGTPWWKNENYIIGKLSTKPRKINVVNTLTQQEHLLEVCSEETISEIQGRYVAFNGHAASYTWKRLTADGEKFIVMEMDKNLEDNGVPDEDFDFEKLHIPDDYYVPVIHVYYNDDLTIA
ncbi:hypothetical protein TrRE_jg13538 [Triparma retinervis]|jgi:hypothetical protein|uniref:Cytochrome b5 domain-containing protein 1 n=1 Tax=Triparma retinervis TaxID=2557542 RepID=A0A9W7G0E0_9STRA|nr:hypothetical protein TrRE_jg13538 [Triparma retinervis]